MMKQVHFLLFVITLLLTACGTQEMVLTEPPTATATPVITQQPTRTPLGVPPAVASPSPISFSQPTVVSQPPIVFQPTAILQPPVVFQPTAILPATVVGNPPVFTTSAPVIVNPGGSPVQPLQNGRGLSNGQVMNNGEFQVEGYCSLLNPAYSVAEDNIDWFCTFNGQRALTLREPHFTDICRRTYSNPQAFAQLVASSQVPNERWRCFEFTVVVTPTPFRQAVLLQNGTGLSTGSPMGNGNFEVEGYCSAINASYGVAQDNNFWYCTSNGQRILTLGVAEFDDICFRTYRVPGAFAQQESNPVPAFGWRCYAYVG